MYYIYRITNSINSKTYIGQHRYTDINDKYMGSGILLIKAFKKYGKENFKKEILYSNIQYKETADSVEMFAIEKERKLSEINKGKHHSDEVKQKMSESRKGRHWFNNRIKSVFCFECPEGFVEGRLYERKR